jgi:hypothetical protein
VFVTFNHVHPSLILAGMTEANPGGSPNETPLQVTAPSIATNIRLAWRWVTMTDNLAYYSSKLITTIKDFMIKGPGHEIFNWSNLKRFAL